MRARLTAARKRAILLKALAAAWNTGLRRVDTRLLLVGRPGISNDAARVYGRQAFGEPTYVDELGFAVHYAGGDWILRG